MIAGLRMISSPVTPGATSFPSSSTMRASLTKAGRDAAAPSPSSPSGRSPYGSSIRPNVVSLIPKPEIIRTPNRSSISARSGSGKAGAPYITRSPWSRSCGPGSALSRIAITAPMKLNALARYVRTSSQKRLALNRSTRTRPPPIPIAPIVEYACAFTCRSGRQAVEARLRLEPEPPAGTPAR